MNQCPYCGEVFRSGTLFCEECGQRLHVGGSDDTLVNHNPGQTARISPPDTLISHVPRLGEYETVRLYVRDARLPIIIPPVEHTLIGRMDQTSTERPDIDLTAYGAREKGVSRIHAAIECLEEGPFIVDMQSTNGVTVNGTMLGRGQSHILHDGDEIKLGRLTAHIYFE